MWHLKPRAFHFTLSSAPWQGPLPPRRCPGRSRRRRWRWRPRGRTSTRPRSSSSSRGSSPSRSGDRGGSGPSMKGVSFQELESSFYCWMFGEPMKRHKIVLNVENETDCFSGAKYSKQYNCNTHSEFVSFHSLYFHHSFSTGKTIFTVFTKKCRLHSKVYFQEKLWFWQNGCFFEINVSASFCGFNLRYDA